MEDSDLNSTKLINGLLLHDWLMKAIEFQHQYVLFFVEKSRESDQKWTNLMETQKDGLELEQFKVKQVVNIDGILLHIRRTLDEKDFCHSFEAIIFL